jgi:hypothetical protein
LYSVRCEAVVFFGTAFLEAVAKGAEATRGTAGDGSKVAMQNDGASWGKGTVATLAPSAVLAGGSIGRAQETYENTLR